MRDRVISEVHRALGGFAREGELVVGWTVSIEIAAPDGSRYLAHRTGGGQDGQDPPTDWAELGMLEVARAGVREAMLDSAIPLDDDEDD